MSYESDIKIDETALDIEWLEQAGLAFRYGRNYAECLKRFMYAEENVKIIRSELTIKVLENPDGTLGKDIKPTGPAIEAYYRTHPKHKKAKEEWITAQEELNLAEIAKQEISVTRKKALENMVTLHGQQYFAGPSVPRNLTREWMAKEKQAKANKTIKMKRRGV